MGKVIILTDTTDIPLTMAGEFAGACWSADTKNHEKNFKRGLECLRLNHGRALEYPQIYMEISGYSARVIREFTRHIGGAPTYLQESTRYVDSTNFEIVVPHTVQKDEKALNTYLKVYNSIQEGIKELEACGVPKEDSAMLLPLGMTTKIIFRTNLRHLIDICAQRLCSRAYWEIRELVKDILDSLAFYSDEWKFLVEEEKIFVPKCKKLGYCPEKFSCGLTPKKE